MAYVALEKLLDKNHDSIYKLVIVAAKRALEIAEGQPRLSDVPAAMKPSTIALHEIADHKVDWRKTKGKE